jgi:GGDEF domain-containing protein
MPEMELPDRTAVLGHVADRLERHRAASSRSGSASHGRASDARPALCVILVEGYPALAARDPLGASAAMHEVARRLDRLVRSGDLLGRLAPDRLVVAVDISPAVAGALVERVRGAVAMPVEVDGDLLSLVAVIGLAIVDDTPDGAPIDPAGLLGRAEKDLALQLGGGQT